MCSNRYSNIFKTLPILIFIILLFNIISPGSAQSTSGAITFKEFIDDFNNGTNQFESYDEGDIVEIEDIINYVIYDSDGLVTKLYLASVGTITTGPYGEGPYIELVGDQSGKYRSGDEVMVSITIYAVDSQESFYTTLDDISHIKKVERKKEVTGINIFGYHIEFPEYLKFLDNVYGRFAIVLLGWFLIAAIALLVLDPIIRKAVEGSKTQLDDMILGIIRKPVLILIILFGLVDSLEELNLPGNIMNIFHTVYGVGFIVMITWIGFKIYKGVLIEVGRQWAKRSGNKLEHILIPVLEKIGTIIISIFGLMYILGYFGINLTLFVAGMGVMGLIIAFAAQDTLSNFFGGIFLIMEPDFKEGDTVKMVDDYYQVRKIGMRTTKLYDIFKHLIVVVPNNLLANEMLINLTEPDRRMKDNVKVGVAYGIDTKRVEKILLEIGNNHSDIIIDDPKCKPFVRFLSFGDSSLDFGLYFWVKDLDDRYRVKHELNHTIHERFEKEGIEIPFPQRVVTMKKE